MTTINPVSMSTPIKSMQQMLPPPPDSSDSHHISNNAHLNSNDINNKIKQLNNSFVPSPNKMSHHVPIAAKPIAANAHHPLLAAKPASTSVNTNNPTANKNTSSQKINSKNQQQQQTLASQQKQQQQTQHQFQQQIQQFQQMQQQQQQRGVFLNGNLNIGSLFSKNNIASNQQMTQQQQLMIAEALKQQCLKNPQLAPAVNNQIQLNNQQIYQLLASQNSNANLLQQQSQQILNKLTNLTNQQQQIDQSKISSNSSAVATATSASSVPQSATIISATTTSDGQIIFQTVPASNTAAALAAIQQHNTNSNNNNNNNNAFLQQNAQLYLNQLLNQQQQNHSQTTPSNIAPKVADCNLQQELQLKQKLLFEEQKFRNLQLQIEQQKSQQNNNKHSPPPAAASARLSPKTNQDNRNDLNQSINSLNKQKNNESPNYIDYDNERRSMSPQDNETSNDNDLTNENENENCQEGPDIIITSNEINKHIPIASNPIHTTTTNNNNNIMKPNYPNKSNSCNKRRGRPRLYAVNPMTGKSMKGRLLSNSPNSYLLTNPKSSKNPKLFPNTSVNSASNFNQIISNATLIPIPIQVQSNGISLYAAAAAAAANSNNNNLIPTPSLFFSNPNNNNNNSNNFPDSNQNNNQQNLQFENENGHGSVTDENPENDHDYSMNETNSYNETEAPVIEQQQKIQINVESNNNQTSCLNNNNNNSEKQLSPITKISNSISKIKPYRLSPKTMKSHVTLTHIIDGYVIKESSKPFPVKPVKTDLYVDQSNLETINNEHEQSTNKLYDTEIKCILCGNENDNEIINGKHSPSFCKSCNKNKEQSLTNSKNISVENNKEETSNNNNNNSNNNLNSSSTSVKQNRKKNKSLQEKLNTLSQNLPTPLPQSAVVSETLPIQSSTSGSPKKVQSVSTQPLFNISNNLSFTNIEQQYPSGDPTEWSCDDVFQFVKCVSGIHVAELFKAQEVDGSALSLIRDDHLVNTMQIKLGPALKIMSRFNDLRSKYNTVK